ncbi:MAG: DNA-binding protein HU [Candidatus Harrisonbacteria bacterium CG10_big_fil_rev_8_21_14_0_10_44_23]|uniref:DNA-binding protein HU n=1 Tax=Candidatus Harrisonbacteria bacterium CG10_big_fil_rev_8_21_14_0_10_44_23 TaxID=1974585 RepID=A0A2H0UQP6_9BACT|nr:MAG: DNA-binding protein HU [Candidatus Harrisonbacteria bacterium CG10_big_fil_rev_8_21_14_0_10_44_23]
MNKAELIDAVMNGAGLDSKAQAERVVNAFTDAVKNELARGGDVAITGFGTFKTAKRAARQGINPKTGEKIQIAAATRPKFTAGKALKEAVNK